MSTYDEVLAAIEDMKKFPPLPVRIEMAIDVWERFRNSFPIESSVETMGAIPRTFQGMPIIVPGVQNPGEWAFVYKSRG